MGYSYWHLCETVRTARGPRQRVIASLGKLDEAQVAELRGGWEDLPALLPQTTQWRGLAVLEMTREPLVIRTTGELEIRAAEVTLKGTVGDMYATIRSNPARSIMRSLEEKIQVVS